MKAIHLTKYKIALVDDEDFEKVNQFKWHANEKQAGVFYAYRKQWIPSKEKQTIKKGLIYNGYYETIPMHRFIMGFPEGKDVDHKDGDGLNNQRYNLRVCSHGQNMYNAKLRKNSRSGIKGISWDNINSKWRVVIQFEGQRINLGRFKELEDAIKIRKEKEKELFGEFQRQ